MSRTGSIIGKRCHNRSRYQLPPIPSRVLVVSMYICVVLLNSCCNHVTNSSSDVPGPSASYVTMIGQYPSQRYEYDMTDEIGIGILSRDLHLTTLLMSAATSIL